MHSIIFHKPVQLRTSQVLRQNIVRHRPYIWFTKQPLKTVSYMKGSCVWCEGDKDSGATGGKGPLNGDLIEAQGERGHIRPMTTRDKVILAQPCRPSNFGPQKTKRTATGQNFSFALRYSLNTRSKFLLLIHCINSKNHIIAAQILSELLDHVHFLQYFSRKLWCPF